MGLTSGRGSHGGARRRRAGNARRGSAWPATAFLDGARGDRRARAGRRRGGVGGWLSGYSAPVISVLAIVVCAAVVAAGLGVNQMLTARSAADATANPNCTLIVPANPLTAQGLATPYQLTATDPAAGPCDESNNNQTAFVQGAVLNAGTGQISIYDPLVVNAGTQPAVAPVVPTLPAGAVVAVWFGYNGNTLTLAGADQNLTTGTSAAATPTQAAPTTSPSGSWSATATAPADTATPTIPPRRRPPPRRPGRCRPRAPPHRGRPSPRRRRRPPRRPVRRRPGHKARERRLPRRLPRPPCLHRGSVGPVRRLRSAAARLSRIGRVAERQPEPSLLPVVVPVRAGDIARVQRAGAAVRADVERHRRAGHERARPEATHRPQAPRRPEAPQRPRARGRPRLPRRQRQAAPRRTRPRTPVTPRLPRLPLTRSSSRPTAWRART